MSKTRPAQQSEKSQSAKVAAKQPAPQAHESTAALLNSALESPHSVLPAQALQLQRQYGNRALQRLLQRAEAKTIGREAPIGNEGGSVGGDLQSQIHSARGGGQPLDRTVGSQVGEALGADLSGVQVHTDSKSDDLNRSLSAQAFTLGSDVFFSKGAYNPGTHSGQRLLTHELTHVVQQGAAGRSQPKANKVQTKLTVGPAGDKYEEEADRVSDQTINRSALVAPVANNGKPGIQRTVKMYKSNDDAREASKATSRNPFQGDETALTVSDVDTALNKAIQELGTIGVTVPKGMKTKMKAKLTEWIKKDARMAPAMAWLKRKFTFGTSLNTGRAQDKRYGSYLALGQALMGHIGSRQHKKTESKLSAKVKKSSYIKTKLQEVQQGIYTAAEAIIDDALKQNFWKGMKGEKGAHHGEYFHWYKSVKDIKGMMQGGTGNFKQAITSIHDAGVVLDHINTRMKSKKEAALQAGSLDTYATGDDFTGTVEKDGNKSREQIKIGYRSNSSTVNEEYDWVKTARAHGALLWAGPSHTTAGMMMLMKSLQTKVPAVTDKHQEAVAWAIFGFWNKDFFTFKDGYHTFHEVMDVAKGFGVPYVPFSYPASPPPAPLTQGTEGEEETLDNVPQISEESGSVSSGEEQEPMGQSYVADKDFPAGSVPSEVDVNIHQGDNFKITDDKFPAGVTDPATDWIKCFHNGKTIYIVALDISNSTSPVNV